jgi:transposase-like protein
MIEAKKRRHYDDAFKREAVSLLVKSGKPAMTVARSIGVDRSNLQKWKAKFGREFVREGVTSVDAVIGTDEFLSLRKEFDSMKETVEHLRAIVRKHFEGKIGTNG